MENDMAKNIPLALIILCAILGILSLFSVWLAFPAKEMFGSEAGYITVGVTGTGLMDQVIKDEIGWISFIPLIIMILGIVAAIVALLPEFGVEMDKRIVPAIIAVVGLVIIILFILYFTKEIDGEKLGDHLGLGAWLGLIIGIVTLVLGGFGTYKAVNQ